MDHDRRGGRSRGRMRGAPTRVGGIVPFVDLRLGYTGKYGRGRTITPGALPVLNATIDSSIQRWRNQGSCRRLRIVLTDGEGSPAAQAANGTAKSTALRDPIIRRQSVIEVGYGTDSGSPRPVIDRLGDPRNKAGTRLLSVNVDLDRHDQVTLSNSTFR